jgi:hypothetical protein
MGHPLVKEVTLDGKVLSGGACVIWQDLCSTFVDVVVSHLEPGEHRGAIRYEYAGEKGHRPGAGRRTGARQPDAGARLPRPS